MHRLTACALCLALSTPLSLLAAEPATDEQKTAYALGVIIGRQLESFDLDADEAAALRDGLSAVLSKSAPALDPDAFRPKIQALAKARKARADERREAPGRAFLEQAAQEPGAVRTPSGLVYRSLKEGSGVSPTKVDTVRTHYRGTFIDGHEFDSSYARGEPVEFSLGQVIACWIEGVGMMKPGGKARLVCPPQLAYGDGNGTIPPRATLVFEVELLEVKQPGQPKAGQPADK